MNGFATSVSAAGVGYFTVRAAVALLLGAAVGLERQWRQRTAGLRTNALVALGAALFELFAVFMTGKHGVDPTRIAAYVVSGIGFLGAGVILRDGIHIRGINTAATIWCSAAVGVLAGAGYLAPAAMAAALILTAHLALRPVAVRCWALLRHSSGSGRTVKTGGGEYGVSDAVGDSSRYGGIHDRCRGCCGQCISITTTSEIQVHG